MQLNDLLREKGIGLSDTLVLRHRPKSEEPELRRRLPWLATAHPDLFYAYQRQQFPRAEKAFTRAKYLASFIGVDAGKALFAGLYAVKSWKPITYDEFWEIPENRKLHDEYGMIGLQDKHASTLWFDLALDDLYKAWIGKLCCRWPGGERSWYRWADRNTFEIEFISQESLFEQKMPKWNGLVLPWTDLKDLPPTWQAALRNWRSIYYIFDVSDRRGYVGSAYGADNLLRRWQQYAKTGHGGNKELRGCDPKNFRFSILQLLNHDADQDEVAEMETKWKVRLHTRVSEGGLNDN